ncbi:hypothetical protein RHSIM_RhsimUnG0225300 [Rhododendron simsii]|uniref:MHD domain-containing protein n=1 Tax=Rhododendron simsii TaxID=118357 RepID=A0A834FU40_RHOSS|nr:hypothetical protein RHSIM_RhsimUnG0225300 [Rhododendron simsii]
MSAKASLCYVCFMCVRFAQFEKDHTISFIQPLGICDLMTYRLSNEDKRPPVWVEAQVERHSTGRVEMVVKTKNQFRELRNRFKELIENFSVQIHVPLPSDATNPSVQTSIGSASYAPEEYMLRTDFKLPSITSEEAALDRKAPITVQFEIPGFSVSRIKVRSPELLFAT